MTHAPTLEVKTIARAVNARAADLMAELLPNGRRSACRRYWETNSLCDNPSDEGRHSLKVELQGRNQGQWRDYATGDHGDIIDLATHRLFGGDKGAAVKWARSAAGLDGLDPARVERVRYQGEVRAREGEAEAAREAEAKKRGARALWLKGVPIAGTPAAQYLAWRDIALDRWPGSLRFHDEVWNTDARVKLPAMLASMVTPAGVQVATHRTFLGRDARTRAWVKADQADLGVPLGNAKKVIGRCAGSFVSIAKGASGKSMRELTAAEPVYVTEGIEDALTVAMVRPGVRVVAAYSLGNLGSIDFPALIDPVVVVADRDGKPAAVDALERAIARLQARGKRVQLVMPPAGFKDMNAWLQAQAREAAA